MLFPGAVGGLPGCVSCCFKGVALLRTDTGRGGRMSDPCVHSNTKNLIGSLL